MRTLRPGKLSSLPRATQAVNCGGKICVQSMDA